jgi:hypothetical protein
MNSNFFKLVKVCNVIDTDGGNVTVDGTIALQLFWSDDYNKVVIQTTYEYVPYLVAISVRNGIAKISFIKRWYARTCQFGDDCVSEYCNSLLCCGKNLSVTNLSKYIEKIGKNGFVVQFSTSEEFVKYVLADKTPKKQTSPAPVVEKKVENKETPVMPAKIAWADIKDDDEKSTASSSAQSVTPSSTNTTLKKLRDRLEEMQKIADKKSAAAAKEFLTIGKDMEDEALVEYCRSWIRGDEEEKKKQQKIADAIQNILDQEELLKQQEEAARKLLE